MMDEGELPRYATYCFTCEAMFFEDEDGHGWEECIECGSDDVTEVSG